MITHTYTHGQNDTHTTAVHNQPRSWWKCAVATLGINKVGPRPYHFCSGPTTRPGSQKSKISVVHNLGPESSSRVFKNPLAGGRNSTPDPAEELIALPILPSWWGGASCLFPRAPPSLLALQASNLGASLLVSPKSVYQNPPM